MPAPMFSRPKPVLIIYCKCEKSRLSLPAPDNTLRELMTSRAACGSKSSSGRQLEPPPFLRVGGTCCHRCRCCFGDEVLILLQEPCFHSLPHFLVPRRARFREEAAC